MIGPPASEQAFPTLVQNRDEIAGICTKAARTIAATNAWKRGESGPYGKIGTQLHQDAGKTAGFSPPSRAGISPQLQFRACGGQRTWSIAPVQSGPTGCPLPPDPGRLPDRLGVRPRASKSSLRMSKSSLRMSPGPTGGSRAIAERSGDVGAAAPRHGGANRWPVAEKAQGGRAWDAGSGPLLVSTFRHITMGNQNALDWTGLAKDVAPNTAPGSGRLRSAIS